MKKGSWIDFKDQRADVFEECDDQKNQHGKQQDGTVSVQAICALWPPGFDGMTQAVKPESSQDSHEKDKRHLQTLVEHGGKNGKMVDGFVGAAPKSQILAKINTYIA